jgi:uncharacterized protein YjiS (DUF1127 family)
MTSITLNADKIGLKPLIDWFKRLDQSMSRNREIRQTIKELNRLTDKELKDIGITRGMIRSVAMERHFDNRGDA